MDPNRSSTDLDSGLSERPVVLDPSVEHDAGQLQRLRAETRLWMVHDTIGAQLRDLVATRHPEREYGRAELDDRVEELLDGKSADHYGRWVSFPWSGRLVHLLPPEEFSELRLDRNRYKITRNEHDRLRSLTVGVAGLSVGNAIALTLALEGSFGHLKLADFDLLDLSNMNRVRAPVHDIGLPKVVLAARQIWEIDPYACISLFPAGITDDCVDEFLQGDPPLNVLVEECDSLRIKWLLRERARDLRIPVLMETSDRGLLDVERFDQEPDRPLFHGLTEPMTSDHPVFGGSTRADKTRRSAVVIDLLGAASLSSRMAASMVEIDRTLSSWPQLASDVTLGGVSVAVAIRRLALGEPLVSGRRYIDIERTVAEGAAWPPVPLPDSVRPRALPVPGLAGPRPGAAPIPEQVRFLVEHATLAPSGGNVQPWHFRFEGDRVWVVHDVERGASILDLRSRASYLALGAAEENIVIAAAHRGLQADVDRFPLPGRPEVTAAVRLRSGEAGALEGPRSRFAYLARRVTNRRVVASAALGDEAAAALIAAARSRGAELRILSGEAELEEVGRILGECDRIRFLCRELHEQLVGELRWPEDDRDRSADGITLGSLELTPARARAIHMLARPDVVARLREWGGGAALAELAQEAMAAASAAALLSIADDEPATWLAGGRSMQAAWLEATRLGIACQPMTAPLFMFDMLSTGARGVFTPSEQERLLACRTRLWQAFGHDGARPAAMLFRFGRSGEPSERAGRLPVELVTSPGAPPGA